MKVIVLKRKGPYDEEYEISGVFSNKKKIHEYKQWLKKNYPALYKDASWDEDNYEIDKIYY